MTIDIDKIKRKIAKVESGTKGSKAKSHTNALGKYQFTKGTTRLLNKKYVSPYKNKDSSVGFSKELDRSKEADQETLMDMLIADNSKTLTNKKIPVNETSLYMAHNIGASSTSKLFKGDSSKKSFLSMSPKTWINNPSFYFKKANRGNDKLSGEEINEILSFKNKLNTSKKRKTNWKSVINSLKEKGYEPMTKKETISKYTRMLNKPNSSKENKIGKDVSTQAMEQALSKKHLLASTSDLTPYQSKKPSDEKSISLAEMPTKPQSVIDAENKEKIERDKVKEGPKIKEDFYPESPISKKASSDVSIEGKTPSVKGTSENTAGVLRPGSDSSTDYLMEPLRQSLKAEPPKDPIKEVFRNSGVDSPGLRMEEDNSTPATDKIASEGAAAFIGVEQKNKEAALRDLKNNDERNRIKENARTGKNVTPMDQLKEALMYFGPQIAASIIVGPEAGAITHKLMEGYRDRLDKQQARAGRNANFQQVDRFVDKEGRPVKFDPVSGKYLDIQGNPVTDFKNLRHERFGQSHKLRKEQHALAEKKAGMLSSKEIEKLSDTITVRKQIEELEKLKEGVQTGPIVGRMTSFAQALGLNTDTDFKALKVQTQSVLSNYVKSISGSQVTEAEAVRLMGVIPSVNDPDELFNAKLKEFEKIVKIGQQAFGFSIAEGNTLKKHQVKALMALLDRDKKEKVSPKKIIRYRGKDYHVDQNGDMTEIK